MGRTERPEPACGACQPFVCRQPGGVVDLADRRRWAAGARLRRRDRRGRLCDPRWRDPSGGHLMSEGVALLTVFVLAVFVGFEVVSKVSSTLHTPLMSGANAIHGVILVGAVIVAGTAQSTGVLVVALIADRKSVV